MVLSGSLRENILADVFHLLAQQKTSGKLILSRGKVESAIFFSDGMIAGAEDCGENLETKLFSYLVDIKKKAPSQLHTLFNSHKNLKSLCNDLLERHLFTKEELAVFNETCIEDITCSFFQWKSGSYRFSSMRTIDPLITGDVAISAETILMEAMRRVDEWNGMLSAIDNETVYVHTRKAKTNESFQGDIYDNQDEYVFSCIDGTKNVNVLLESCCLCKYKVYESINFLLEDKKIAPLSSTISRSIQAALTKDNKQSKLSLLLQIATSMTTALCIAAVIVTSGYLLHFVPFARYYESAENNLLELECSQYRYNLSSAQLHHRVLFGLTDSTDYLVKSRNCKNIE